MIPGSAKAPKFHHGHSIWLDIAPKAMPLLGRPIFSSMYRWDFIGLAIDVFNAVGHALGLS